MSRISILRQVLIATAIAAVLTPASRGQQLPNTGRQITPLAPREARFEPLNPGLSDNPLYTAGQAVTSIVSPDGKTLLVLTSGYNLVKYTSGSNEGALNSANSTQFVFVYDITQDLPVQKQVIQIPNTYNGIAFDPSGTAFYVGGGADDSVYAYALTAGVWAEETGSPIALGHTVNPATDGSGVGLEVSAQAAGVAITQDGTKLVVTNYYNDSISILTKTKTGWAVVTKGMDFSKEDQVDGAQFNRILWKGLMGSKPYPATPTGLDLRANRAQLLERYRATSEQVPVQSSQKLVAGTGGGQ